MTKVHSAPHPFELENLRNVLEAEGIASEVKTRFLGAARGDIPATECKVRAWVLDDRLVKRALEVIRASETPDTQAQGTWACRSCGEDVEVQFGACWKCGSAAPNGNP